MLHAFINVDGNLIIAYLIDSTTSNSALPTRTEFFVPDSVGEEGKTFIGGHVRNDFAPVFLEVILGNAAALGVVGGDLIVATATDAGNNTSEFSASVSITVAATPTPTPTPTPIPSLTLWGLIAMAVLMALVAYRALRRRQGQAAS